MGKVVLLPRHSRATREQAEHLRYVALDLELSPEARAELDNALFKITEVPGKRWVFVMISPEQFRFVKKATGQTAKPDLTWGVFSVALTYIRMDTGEIMASREQLAEDAVTTVQEVSRAMSALVEIGAITKEKRGRKTAYFINPTVGWAGKEGPRVEAAKTAPQLRLVMPGEP